MNSLSSRKSFRPSVLFGLMSKGYATDRQAPEPQRARTRRRVLFETLEPRVLLSSDLAYAFAGNLNVSDIKVSSDGTNIAIIDTGSNSTLSSQPLASTSAVRIAGSGGDDHVTVDLTNPFDLPVFFDDSTLADGDTLSATGQGLEWELSGVDTGHANGGAGIFFSNVEGLGGDGSKPDTFAFLAGAFSTDGVDGGAGDFDAVRFGSNASLTLTDTLLDSQPITGIERAFIDAPSVTASAFSGQVFLSSAVASWVEQGPQPYTQILDGATVPWDPVSGAIQTIAVDPNDRFTMYIGTTNGGVWRNTGSTEVLFDTNDHALDATDMAEIDKFAKFLLAHPDVNVEIGGHTDSSGDAIANQTLSVQRATAVSDYLVGTWKISQNRLTVVGFGEDRPVALNSDPVEGAGHQPLNRRVELLVQNWEPVTQDFPSLSIGSIAISAVDSKTIYAGTSRTSSFGRTGGFPDGVLFSSDGGDHWRLVADPMLNGLLITKVLPTTMTPVNVGAEVVFISTFDTDRDNDTVLDDRGGVFRLEIAADGTLKQIDKVSNLGVSNGLPRGHYTDLAFDPGDGGARAAAVYAATPKSGIFKSTNAAGTSFGGVNTGVQFGDNDLVPGDDLLQVATRVQLAVHAGTGVLYAGFVGATDANGIFNLTGKQLGLIGLFKTTDGGANWTPIVVPTTVDGTVTHGLHPGGQGDTHFSIAVDPTNSNVVYVGGDAQPDKSVTGQSVQAGRIFRFNPGNSQWVQVIGHNAAETAPHADSRGIVFANDFTLLEIDDGGLYRLQNPRADTDQGARKWASLNRGLVINEVLGAAFDNLNNSLQTGSQDDGSAIQVGTMDGLDNNNDGVIDDAGERFFWLGTGGDGNSQATIGIDTNGDTIVDRTLRYALHNNFSFLQVYEVNGSGQFVDAKGVPTASAPFTTIGFRSGPGAKVLSGLNQQDQKLGFDKIPMVVNSVNPTRMLIGHAGIYESINTNINPAAGQTRVLPFDQVRQLDPAVGVAVPNGSEVTALVFGGVTGGTPNAEVVLAARSNNVLFRSAATGPDSVLKSSTVAGANTLTALAVDPDDWRVVYAADSFDVYRNADITDPNSKWVKITGNLNKIGQGTIQSLQFVEAGGVDVLLVGGRAGVTRLLDPGTATDGAVWTRFGENLPNAPVFTLQYIDRTQNGLTTDDLLLAGTLGRGAWTMTGDSLMSLGKDNVLTVLGRSSATDTLSLTIEQDNPLRFDIVDAGDLSPDPAFSARFASFSSVRIDTRGGADALTVDHSFGAVAVPGGIDYDGGTGSNTLTLSGGPVASHVTTGPVLGITTDTVKVGSKTEVVRSQNVGSLVDNIPDPLTEAFDVFAGALDSLVGLLTFRDGLSTNVPLFGTSLGNALNGIKAQTGTPLGEKEGGVTVPLSEQVEEASGQTIDLLRRFIETGHGAFSIADFAKFTTLGEIVAAFKGLDESAGTVTSTDTLGGGFEITLSGITKRLSGEADVNIDLDLPSTGSVHLHGLVDMSAEVTLNLILGLDNTHGFYLKSTGAQEVEVAGIQVTPGQDAVAEGEFGFLGVTVSDLALVIDPLVHFDIDLAEQGGDGYMQLAELTADPVAYTNVTLVGNGSTLPKDVSVTGKFDVAVLIPGFAAPFSLGLGDARATIAWTDITAAQLNAQSNVTIGPVGGSALGDTLMEFLKIDVGDFAASLTTLKGNLDSVFGTEVPFLSDGLTELVDLVNTFQHKVIDPISGLNGNPAIPSIQSLVSTLAQKIDLTPDQMGLAFDPVSGELTYHLLLSESIVGATRDLGSGVDFAGGLADLQFNSQATLDASVVFDAVFGVDIDGFIASGDPLVSFFLRDAQATLQADILASDIEASARFGFLSIGIDQGALTTAGGSDPGHIFVTVALKDPGTQANDGRVDLGEIVGNLDDLGKLVTVTGGGALQLVLPVETSFVPGLGPIANGTPIADLLARAIIVTIPDLATPETIDVALGAGLTDVANFKNIDAVSMVGVLGQLTYWLDQFRRSDTFANLDLPLVGPALDEALQFADNLRDGLLIDDRDNQLDDKKALLYDLNAALESAGLGRKLYAANDGDSVKFIALDAAITAFTVAGATGLGFNASQIGTKPAGKSFAEAKAANPFAANGKVGSDVSFTVTIGTKLYTVEIKQAQTDDNTSIGDDVWKLVNAQNAPTFATAQEMVPHLLDALGAGHVLTYDPATQSLNFSLDLSQVFSDLNLPFNFDVKQLPPYLQLQTSGALALKVSGGLNLDVGVFLGAAEPHDKLQDGSTAEPVTQLVDLSQPIVIGTNQTYTASPVVGKLTGDAAFKVFVNGASGVDVAVTKIAAQNNLTVADLVADLNEALTTAGLNLQVLAQAVPATGGLPAPSQVQLVGIGATTTLKVTAAATDPAVTDIGLPSSKEVTGASPTIVATKTLPPLKGRLTADAGFTIALNDGVTPTDFAVLLTPDQTKDNNYPFSIVNDIEAQLQTARIKVDFSRGSLTFSSTDGSAIEVRNVTGKATDELGIVAGQGDGADLRIAVRRGAGGTTYRVSLDGATTIADIIDKIAAQTDNNVTVSINASGSGLDLKDETFDDLNPGTGKFRVETLNNSTAGLLLGIVGVDEEAATGEATKSDGLIKGSDIAALTALDRFFVKSTESGDPLAGLTVEVGTPSPITASAKFGFVGLGLQGDGGLTGPDITSANNALNAALTLRLMQPEGSTDGRVSLAEMIDALANVGGVGSLFALSLTGQGQLNLSLTPQTKVSLADLGIGVGADPRIEITADMSQNVFDGHAPVFSVTLSGFDQLANFGNVDFNSQSIVAGLSALVDFLDQFEALSFLNDPIPVVDVSVKDLVSFVGQFADAVTAAQNDPAGSLQVLEDKLKAAFGLPLGSNALDLTLVDGPIAGHKVLKIDTQLSAAFSKSLPINLDLGLDPLQFGGNADLLAQGSAALDLDFGIDVSEPTNLYIFNTTGFTATLNLAATDLDFKAAVGPLGVFVSDGNATIHGTLPMPPAALPNTVLAAGFQDAYAGTGGMQAIGDIDLGTDLTVNVGGVLDVNLPVFFPTESVKAGTVKVIGNLSYVGGELKADLTPSAVGADGVTPVALTDLFAFNPANLSLLDQLLLGVDGIDTFLGGLQDLLDGQIGSFTLPLVGDKLAGAADAIGDFRSGFVEGFRKTLEDLANPALAFAEAGFGGGAGGATLVAAPVPQGVDPVSKLLWQLLGPDGLHAVNSKADIVFDTNIKTEPDPSKVFFDWKLHMGGDVANVGAGIGFDLGIPGLGLETEGAINLTVDWALDLGFGLNFDDGFYLDIGDSSEMELTARVTTPGLEITGKLGFLQISAQENVEAVDDPGNTGLAVQFGIDIYNRQDKNDQRLGFAELGRIGIDAKIAGDALADLDMSLKLNSDLVPNPGNFPSVVADFQFQWGVGTVDDPNTPNVNEFDGISLSDLHGSFLKDGLQYVGFKHVGLDLGKYFSDVIGPIVDKVQEVAAPIKPFLDFLTEPIPVISQLAGPTSLLDIASMSGLVNPGIIKAIETVDQVVDIVSQLKSINGDAILYFDNLLPDGALTIYQAPPAGAKAAAGGIPGFDPSKPFDADQLKGFVDTLPKELGPLSGVVGTAAQAFSDAVTKMRPGGATSGGFKLPIIEDPSEIFGMLLGQPADLITFTMAPLELKAEFSAFFSIFGPLGVSINAEFGAQFGPFTFGYDTYGITQFAASDFRNPALLFDGLYIGDLDAKGNDSNELHFDAGLWAAAELNLGIARGGVGGGLFAEINFNLYDPDHDGKVRIKELINTIDNEIKYGDPAVAPLAIFDISGKLTAELFAFLKIDLGFFNIDEKFDITDPITLLSFENAFTRYPTLATELGNGTLQLNIGKNATARTEGDLTDVGEAIHVKQGKDASQVLVWSDQFGVDEAHAQKYEATNAILAFGGEGDDVIDLAGVTSSVKYELYGDAGNDKVTVGTAGTGAALLVGGSGDDELKGGGGNDTLFGEAGVDKLWGGDGADWLFGDGDPKEYQVGSVITVGVKGSDGVDELYGDGGDDLLVGSGGSDKLEGGADNDVLIGDGGEVTIVAGGRVVAATRELDGDPLTSDTDRVELAVRDTSRNGKGAVDKLDGGSGDDHLYGGFGNDVLLGGDDNDVIYGELGSDTADGSKGNDVVFGDFGRFIEVKVGNLTTLEPQATTGGEKDDLSGGDGNDKLLGGAGNDNLQGNAGNDSIWGGTGQDQIWGDNTDGTGTGNDKLYGEADSDTLRAGDGNDYLEGGGGNDLALGGAGSDTLVAGYGSDTLDGEADGDTYRVSVRGGSTTEITTAYDTGASGVDSLIVVGTQGGDTLLLRAMADSYFPTIEKLNGLVERYFKSTLADRLAGMVQSFNDAYGPWDLPPGLIDALTTQYQAGLLPALHAAVDDDNNRTGDPNEPTKAVIKGLVDQVLASEAESKIDAMQKAITAEYAKANSGAGVTVPSTLFSALIAAYRPVLAGDAAVTAFINGLQAAISPYYVDESLYPREFGLQVIVDDVYADSHFTTAQTRFTEIDKRITDAFGSFSAENASMLAALQAAWDALPDSPTESQQESALKGAITATYTPHLANPDTFTNTAFVAVINDGGQAVERFNYRRMEGLVVNTLGGNDYVVVDDLLAAATINLGDGNDRVQVGQVFRSERVKDPQGELITGITAEDVFTTLEITRGWLSNGVSVPTTINGGDGDDDFTVFRNVAVLNLNGGDGDDVFTVRAFALKGSSDNERARTDMKGDGGADTILYVVNAPVGIDGGDGFDTVRIVGTEFGDDFVITDSGIFGAGLNVSYVNVERLVADGAEGDDRFFVQCTGLDVVTEIDGGLGSDTFFVGGNPSRAPVAVVSNDLRGHSGIILHSVTEASDSAWAGLAVEGLSANVADNEEGMILLAESGGRSMVVEGAVGPALGATDTYRLRLSRPPEAGKKVVIAVVPAGLSPEEQAKNFADLEVWDPDYIDPVTHFNVASWQDTRTVELTDSNWDTGVEVLFRAKQDVGYEGRRFTFINHKITEATTDVTYLETQVRSLKVQMDDDDRDGVIVVPSGLGNTVLEGDFTDDFKVMLSQAPSAPVTVTMTVTDPTYGVALSTYTLTFEPDNANGKLWSTPQTVTVSAINDGKIEGFHTDFIQFDVSSTDHDETKGPFTDGQVVLVSGTPVAATTDPISGKVWLQVDGNIDDPGQLDLPSAGSTYVLLPNRPVAGTVAVRVAGAELAISRFSLSGNTITFLSGSGAPELLTGKVEVNYHYKVVGYDQSEVRDQYVDIYDNDAPAVIIRQADPGLIGPTGDGMLDVVEGDPASSDTYTVRLSMAPTQDVHIAIDSARTRTTWGGNAYFEKQVLLSDGDESNKESITLTFTAANWNVEQTVTVRAIDDARIDGNDTQVFAPDLQTVNKIRGPLIIEGAAGAGSLSLPAPLLMPWERNIRPSDGNVLTFEAADKPAGAEYMTVERADLNEVVARFKEDDPTFIDVAQLVGKTLEMSKGAGTGIVLDPSRPDDKFDRFWLITHVEKDYGGDQAKVRLTLQNPTAVDPTQGNVIAPDDKSEFAITSLSVNFFADEREQVDYLFVYDNDSVADDVGALTSSDGAVFEFNANANAMRVDTSALQSAATLLGLTIQDLATQHKQIEITVGPAQGRVWTIAAIDDFNNDPNSGQKLLTLTDVSGMAAGTPSNRSEFRIDGSDRHGRITGFGMGPNILFAGKPQGGGVTYGDIEVAQVELGSGNDAVRVDYATNAEDHATVRTGDYYTQTILKTGGGNDVVTVTLTNGDGDASGDGAFALDTGDGNDKVFGEASTRSLVVFGGAGDDEIHTGSGDDIAFGDIGRVDYTKKIDVSGVQYDAVVTRLGSSVPQNPVNPHVTAATGTTISDDQISSTYLPFPEDEGGLVGLSVQVITPEGHVQFRTIIANTADAITVDAPWTEFPVFTGLEDDRYYYRVSSYPDDQTDGLFRGPRVIWSVKDAIGGRDKLYTGAGDDIAVGGKDNDEIDAGLGTDKVAGDDARFDFVPVAPDGVETRLAQIADPGSIGDDILIGGDSKDVLIGGLGKDKLYGFGDDDVLIGDAVTITYGANGLITNIVAPADQGDSDEIYGGGGRDLAIGGALGDHIEGGSDVDVLVGDAATVSFDSGGIMVTVDAAIAPSVGGADEILGDGGDDVLIGGAQGDRLDGGAQDDLVFGDNVVLLLNPSSGDAVKPRFRTVAGTIYDAGGNPQVGAVGQMRPGSMPAWADWHITLDQSLTAGNFGDDTIAGGANDDTIFGQRGNDKIQGDGSINNIVGWTRDTNGLQVSGSVEDAADGDDYIEGNAGQDLIFGNLGQDDLIGGSSTLFSLGGSADLGRRDDGEDMVFGGAGSDVARNNLGDGMHGRDADMILGDNGNIYRLVADGAYRLFGYDALYGQRIVVRAAELLDYTPGGADFSASAGGDIGAADELHGESGDDFIYGMKGNDVLFGEGQDDDLLGGYGNDWISGGTGDDGVIGDDGRIVTSRNGTVDPLGGVIATTQGYVKTGGGVQQADTNVTGQLKKTVNLTPFSQDPAWNAAADEFGGTTKGHSDDIIFGGWGNDFLHGGTGDDAISGAEALAESYAPTAFVNGMPTGRIRIDYNNPVNPGNVLAYNPLDANGKSSNVTRAGEFYLYNEYDPLRKILLDSSGKATTWTATGGPTGGEYFLNFDASAVLALPANGGPISVLDPTKRTDGDDKIFGDLGNDWLVGGSGRDDMYGGFGNDLLNANDDLTTDNSLNDQPVKSASYEDRAFGGAGRDVLIANTGGDRLIDWSGEFNSYLVPFSPFGTATVSRTLQPGLAEFLYALSASDGADPTRAADAIAAGQTADPTRNGEPWGELGLVLQQDAAWKDQHGGPADPQPGNIGGTQRDVLRSATFTNGAASGFNVQVGTGVVVGNRYQTAPAVMGGDAVSLFDQADTVIPAYFEMQATINAVKPTGGNKANAFLIFDWQSDTNFKFAGIDVSTNKLEIGHRTASGWVVDNWTVAQVKAGTDYVIMLKANGSTATAIIGTSSVSYAFAPRIDAKGIRHLLNEGITGIGGMAAAAQIDNVIVQKAPEPITVDITADFSSTSPASRLFNSATAPTGSWVSGSDNRLAANSTDANVAAINLASVGAAPITAGSLLNISTTVKTSGLGGVVFDYQGPNYYKYVVLSVDTSQILVGHRTGNSWVTDATYAFSVSSSTDYKLGVSLRGGLVNVSINGGILLSQIYAETVTVGGYGLISRKGVSSGASTFDIVEIKSDEGRYAPATQLLLAATPAAAPMGGGDTPNSGALNALLAEAKSRWVSSGLDAASMARLGAVTVQLADLPGASLGEEVSGTVFVDADGAGRGWFIDRTPSDDHEFGGEGGAVLSATPGGGAAGRFDLLSVIAHELGHVIGLDHSEGGVMAEQLLPGDRALPAAMFREAWRGDWPGGASALAPAAAMAIDLVPAPAAVPIDWNVPAPVASTTRSPAAAAALERTTDRWQQRFVNHLGATQERLHPNAGVRIHLPIAPSLSRL